jgi:hypothetical protein
LSAFSAVASTIGRHGSTFVDIALTFLSLIAFTDKEPKDFMVPSRWGTVSLHVAGRICP